jgi:hypothetical protein
MPGVIVASKATRSQHYLNIAEFYGRMLVEDMRDGRIPEFVLAQSARRAAHFALVGVRLAAHQRSRTPAWRGSPRVFAAESISAASLS